MVYVRLDLFSPLNRRIRSSSPSTLHLPRAPLLSQLLGRDAVEAGGGHSIEIGPPMAVFLQYFDQSPFPPPLFVSISFHLTSFPFFFSNIVSHCRQSFAEESHSLFLFFVEPVSDFAVFVFILGDRPVPYILVLELRQPC